MSHNTAQQGAAIYVDTQKLTNDSYIRNITFANNDSLLRGAVFLSFDEGIMEIS